MQFLTKAGALGVVLAGLLCSPAWAQQVPGLPDIGNGLPQGDVERFQVTVRGTQHAAFKYTWHPPDLGCSVSSEGTLSEFWEYARGKSVVMEFNRLPGGIVLLKRAGRSLGDSSFAAPGSVTRDASGYYDYGVQPGCGGMFSLVGGDCGTTYKVNSNFNLLWSKGKLSLRRGSKLKKTPVKDCGEVGGALSFDGLVSPYPYLEKQRGALTARQIFHSKRNLKVVVKDKYLAQLREDAPGLVVVKDVLSGSTTITFKRLKI